MLHDLIPQVVGDCVTDEYHNPLNGDGLQESVSGLLVWRKADNWTLTGSLATPEVQMNPDGRANQSGYVILQTIGGLRDTVKVLLSGLVLTQ